MSFCHLRRRALILATLAALPVGCSERVEVAPVPASAVTQVKKEDRAKHEVQPKAGSSAGMNYNPGGPPPGAPAADDH